MSDVLSVLRELRSLEQKKEVGSLTPEETARLEELQSTLSSRYPPIAVPREEGAAPDAPFVDAVLQEEPTESRTGVMPRDTSAFDVEPPSASPPSYGTPFKTPPPISPRPADLPPGRGSAMSPSELQQWGQIFAAPAPLVAEKPPAGAPPSPPFDPPPQPTAVWPVSGQAVLTNAPVEGAGGFSEGEKTVMEQLPSAPPAPAFSSPSVGAPARPMTGSWEIPQASQGLAPPSAITPVPVAAPPAPAPSPKTPAPAWPAPSLPTPMPQAWQQAIPAATADDAPAVWAQPAPRVPQYQPPPSPADLPSFEIDAVADMTTIGGGPASAPPPSAPAPPLAFSWPKPPPASPSVSPFARTFTDPAPPPFAAAPPPQDPLEQAVTVEEVEQEFDETAPGVELPPIEPEPEPAEELQAFDLDETDDKTAINPIASAAFASPPAPQAAPQAPPPMASRPPPDLPLHPTVSSPSVPAPAEPTWRGSAAGSRPYVAGESRVVIHTLEGVQKRGTLYNADLSAPALDLTLPDGRSELVATANLKVVFFMVPMGLPVPKPQGAPVTVTLHDGRQLEGLSPDYKAGAAGFFVCPLDQRSRAARIYVYAPAVKEIL